MRATVNQYLNARKNSPSVNAENPFYYTPGDEVEVVHTVIGDQYKGNNVWFQLANGVYVWSGGLATAHDSLPAQPILEFNFSTLLKLHDMAVPSSQGNQGIIALLDSGISNTSLTNKIVNEQSFVPGVSSTRDEKGHGTKVAGILCGDDDVIKSLTSQCRIINYRVSRSTAVFSNPVFNALTALVQSPVSIDVINMSLSVPDDLIPMIQPLIDALLAKGTITVVAAGNSNDMNSMAGLNNVIKVCAIGKENFSSVQQQGLNTTYHCGFIDIPIRSTTLADGHDYISAASAYTPVVSTLVLAFLKENPQFSGKARLAEVVSFISRCSFPIKSVQPPLDFRPIKP